MALRPPKGTPLCEAASFYVGYCASKSPYSALCIPTRREHNSPNYCIDSNQILLNDKDRQLFIVVCAPGAKSAIYDCLAVFCKRVHDGLSCKNVHHWRLRPTVAGLFVCSGRSATPPARPSRSSHLLEQLVVSNSNSLPASVPTSQQNETQPNPTQPIVDTRQLRTS